MGLFFFFLPFLPVCILSFLSFVLKALFIQFSGLLEKKLFHMPYLWEGMSSGSSCATILNGFSPFLIASHSLLSYKLMSLGYSWCAKFLKRKMTLLMDYALTMAFWQIFLPGKRVKYFPFYKLWKISPSSFVYSILSNCAKQLYCLNRWFPGLYNNPSFINST